MRDFDVKIDDESYNFGTQGGLGLGKATIEPGGTGGPLEIGTLVIPSLHHGPGQTVQRDPEQYLKGERLDVGRPGLALPAGGLTTIYTGVADVFDSIHGSSFFEVDGVLKLITPKAVFDIDTAHAVTVEGGDSVLTGSESYTGSWARWRGKIILAVEANATGGDVVGGDTSTRSEGGDATSEGAPIIYDVSADSYTQLVTPGTWEYPTRIVTNRNSLWWVSNHGRYGAPELYWTDDAATDFGSISEANTFGPFTIPMGGYCTGLHLAGPHILVFKRDGTIIGVDEQKIWTPYSPERGFLEDDTFGHGAQQYLSVVVVPDKSGALLFDPNTLQILSADPSFVQQYPAYTNESFMGIANVFSVRGAELYTCGITKDGSVVLYVGTRFEDGSFAYASDYGVFAAPGIVAGVTGEPFTVQDVVDAEGSEFRPAATPQTFRAPTASTVADEEPVASHVSRHTHGGTLHYHLYLANRRVADSFVKIYAVDIPTPGYTTGPTTLATKTRFTTSKMWGASGDSGQTKIPLQLRGYLDTTAISGSGAPSINFSLGLDEAGLQVVGTANASGIFALPMPAPLNEAAGRAITVDALATNGAGWRLELPIFVDYLIAPESGIGKDYVNISLTIGETSNLLSINQQEMSNEIIDRLLKLKNTAVNLEFHWGSLWKVWVEQVSLLQAKPNTGGPNLDGIYVVRLSLRRLS